MAEPLLTTKLYVPPVPSRWVSRPHLIERLNDGLRLGKKLILVSAPAGFGKTTLVGDWIRREELPAAWISLDQDDDDPVRFWSYLIAALQSRRPGLGQDALRALRSPQPPAIESLLVAVINEVAERSESLVLVLDDLHTVRAQSIHDTLVFLIDHLPPQMHLVIATRYDPPLALARLRARGELTELRMRDLCFSLAPGAVLGLLGQSDRLARVPPIDGIDLAEQLRLAGQR